MRTFGGYVIDDTLRFMGEAHGPKRAASASAFRARQSILFTLIVLAAAAPAEGEGPIPGTTIPCAPVSERAGRELGCWVLGHQVVGQLPAQPVYWHLQTYATRAAAEAVRPSGGTVVDSFAKVWLFTIARVDQRPPGGQHVASIGPLPIKSTGEHTARYLEAVFAPDMISVSHRHGGPEAWFTLAGATCLETPEGKFVGRAGGEPVIVPGGLPMHLTAIGTEQRRALVLIRFDSAQPHTSAAPDWRPRGLVTNHKMDPPRSTAEQAAAADRGSRCSPRPLSTNVRQT